MSAAPRTCSFVRRDGSVCDDPHQALGLCDLHFKRHKAGWTEEEMSLPRGARRASRPCPVVLHLTGVECGEPAFGAGLCGFHLNRRRSGYSDDELGLPKGANRTVRATCSIIEDNTGFACPDDTKADGMCKFHYQRAHKGWPADRLGAPRARRTRVAVAVDLAALRTERERFCEGNTTGENYIRPLRQWRLWLERLAVDDAEALFQPEEVLVAAFVAQRCTEGGSASKVDVPTAAISWWARHDGRPDPTAATRDLRRAHRRANAARPAAGELTLDGVRRFFEVAGDTSWPNRRDDPDNVDRFARAVVLTMFHLAARYSDLARLSTDDVRRTEEGWRVVPWVRKNWPGGTPDGLWLVPTRDPLFDPVAAMDTWMEFRGPLGDGYLFCGFDGAWHRDEPFSYDQLDVFMRRVGATAGFGALSSGVFRRTMTQLLTAQGATDAELMRLLGHRDTRTLRRYQSKKAAPSAGEQLVALYGMAAGELDEENDDGC